MTSILPASTRCRFLGVLLGSVLLMASPALAQVDTGTVQGTVRDASGAWCPAPP